MTSIVAKANGSLVKLAPATELATADIDDLQATRPVHRCWIALQGNVREQTLLVGDTVDRAKVSSATRSAISMSADGTWHRFLPSNDADEPDHDNRDGKLNLAHKPLAWMIDPVSSIRAAGLTKSFANQNSLDALGGANGFLTCDHPSLPDHVSALATIGCVQWIGSADDRKLRRELRSHNWFPQTIKCRATGHDPAELFRRYRQCGDIPVTLWIGRIGRKVYAVLTDSQCPPQCDGEGESKHEQR